MSVLLTTDRAAFREALPQGGRLLGMDVGTPIYSNMVVLDMELIGQRD